MATPVGHYLLGLAIASALARDEKERKQAFWLANIAWFPDLDFLPGLLVGNFSQFHHGVTHSLAAAAIFSVAVVVGLAAWQKRWTFRLLIPLFLIFASHVALDYVTLDNSAPHGIPVFWPFSSQAFASPWLLLPNVQHTSAPLISWHNFILTIQEALVFLPLVGLVYALKGWWRIWPRTTALACGSAFLVGVIVSILWLVDLY